MARTVTCPKCSGTGHIEAFAHIANGDCFACGTSGRVIAATTTTKENETHPSWIINTAFGNLTICRTDTGLFDAYHKNGCIFFSIKNGKVNTVILSDAMTPHTSTTTAIRILQEWATKSEIVV